jgi:hypothetical protein
MTARTRRTVILCLVAVAIMLPVETILLRALSEPDQQASAEQWVETLSGSELHDAALEIQQYPFVYRREIMQALTPDWRSIAWRAHLQRYVDDTPGLDAVALQAIQDASETLSPETFDNPNSGLANDVRAASEALEQLLSREDAEFLMYRLGPLDGTFASKEPIIDRLAHKVRGLFVAMARQDDCECSTEFGCDGYTTHCSDAVGCEPDEEWPMCGWGWMQTCDGMCLPGGGA